MSANLKGLDYKVHAEGTVTDPPDVEEILDRLAAAVPRKEPVTLSPGEVRVLVLYLSQ